MERVLIVEDDEQLSRLLELELMHIGYQADVVMNGNDVTERLRQAQYDLILLDLMLPGIDGMEVCRRVRLFSKIPIIMLTAKGEIADKIEGLDMGADDYITKPFDTDELLARIRVALRRNENNAVSNSDVLQICDLTLKRSTREVIRAGQVIALSKREFDLLEYMIMNKNIVLTRENIINNIWGYDFLGDSNTVDVYIRYLRSKVDDPFEQKILFTYRGVGYSAKEN